MIVALSLDAAHAIFNLVWRGERKRDDLFRQALAVVGMSETDFDGFRTEARRQERGKSHRVVLTPTGSGRRR